VTAARRSLLAMALAVAAATPFTAVSAQDSPTHQATDTSCASADSGCAGSPRKHPLRAVLEGVATNVFMNRVDAWVFNSYNALDGYWARVGPRTWSQNIRLGWVWDTDDFMTNMFLHPYHGATYFRFGRTNGLDFWESTPLTFLGSLEWEYFAETTRPSLNDLYNTSFGGIVMGEVTHRLLAMIRDNRARGWGRALREVAAVPIDLPGSVNRLLTGDATRVYANAADREPGAFGLRLQGGVQAGADSISAHRRSVAGTVLLDVAYGDPFAERYTRPFDVFQVRLRASTSGRIVNKMRVQGRLYARELTDPAADVRWIFTVAQKMEYDANPAYNYGAQSLELGFVSGFALGTGLDVQTALYAEGIMMGAVDAPAGDTAGSGRTYDFGPGVGFDVSASFRIKTFQVLSARWHWAYLHSVSGSSADHYIQFPSLEATVPLTRSLGIGAYAGWYQRRSAYAAAPGETTAFPEYRLYLVWRTHRGALPSERP
jgi:hypothetical protein